MQWKTWQDRDRLFFSICAGVTSPLWPAWWVTHCYVSDTSDKYEPRLGSYGEFLTWHQKANDADTISSYRSYFLPLRFIQDLLHLLLCGPKAPDIQRGQGVPRLGLQSGPSHSLFLCCSNTHMGCRQDLAHKGHPQRSKSTNTSCLVYSLYQYTVFCLSNRLYRLSSTAHVDPVVSC